MRALADVVYLAHATFTVAMLASPAVLPWQFVVALCVAVAIINATNGNRCPLTVWEFRLRRQSLPASWITLPHPEWYAVGDTIVLSVANETDKDFDGRYYIHKVGDEGLFISRYLPSESVMARLLRVIGIHATPAQVQRLMLALLVGLPLVAYLREVLMR